MVVLTRRLQRFQAERLQFLTQSNIDHTVNSCAVGEYKSELSGADIIIASTHIAGEISV
ncbi:hypothetical protein ONQ97_25610, partial [Salmonella enterica subsp. enterica serovar Virginia]|nr:hypothetical protein [Salmonella enterica subsp. enterica serovar Virginia]